MNPTIAADGHTYERSAIEHWLKLHSTSPVTGHSMQHSYYVQLHYQMPHGKPLHKLSQAGYEYTH